MIADNKLRQLFELKKSISLSAYYLGEETTGVICLYIDYEINGEFKNIRIENVPEICRLLMDAGLIKNCQQLDPLGNCSLTWETETNTERNGEHYQECKTCYGSFAEFVEQTRFTLNDANEVVAFYIINNQKELA